MGDKSKSKFSTNWEASKATDDEQSVDEPVVAEDEVTTLSGSETYSVYRVKCKTFTVSSTGKVCTEGLPIALSVDELKTQQVIDLISAGKLETL